MRIHHSKRFFKIKIKAREKKNSQDSQITHKEKFHSIFKSDFQKVSDSYL